MRRKGFLSQQFAPFDSYLWKILRAKDRPHFAGRIDCQKARREQIRQSWSRNSVHNKFNNSSDINFPLIKGERYFKALWFHVSRDWNSGSDKWILLRWLRLIGYWPEFGNFSTKRSSRRSNCLRASVQSQR